MYTQTVLYQPAGPLREGQLSGGVLLSLSMDAIWSSLRAMICCLLEESTSHAGLREIAWVSKARVLNITSRDREHLPLK